MALLFVSVDVQRHLENAARKWVEPATNFSSALAGTAYMYVYAVWNFARLTALFAGGRDTKKSEHI